MDDEQIVARAREWMVADPDPQTRAVIEEWIRRRDLSELHRHFDRRLDFGTAGIRGPVGPGSARMNLAAVRRISTGLATYLLRERGPRDGAGVVVGYDGRRDSLRFAQEVAAVCASAGLQVWTFEEVCPTPVLAYAVVALRAAAGVMITASHNPPEDNGYKVFWSDGAQVIPPYDRGISEAIDATPPLDPEAPESRMRVERIRPVPRSVLDGYEEAVLGLRVHRDAGRKIVYTAMHGVGWATLRSVFSRAGHTEVTPVSAQRDPHPDFPTVRSPNPEEPGALDLAVERANAVGADLILANDPDADRLAVAVRGPDGSFRILSGNQIGILLADDLLRHLSSEDDRESMVICTIVSTGMLEALAERAGVAYAQTLTGFKWIASRAMAHERRGGRFVFGFEESLGYMVGDVVRDKDGISAALLFADLVASLSVRGETVWDRLEELYRALGIYLTRQRSVYMRGDGGARRRARLMEMIREAPPQTIEGAPLVEVTDLLVGARRDVTSGQSWPVELPSSDVLAFRYGADVRILARPSGTEPKVKFYFEVRRELVAGETLSAGRAAAEAFMDRVVAAWAGAVGV